jgi:hypothetical protein
VLAKGAKVGITVGNTVGNAVVGIRVGAETGEGVVAMKVVVASCVTTFVDVADTTCIPSADASSLRDVVTVAFWCVHLHSV